LVRERGRRGGRQLRRGRAECGGGVPNPNSVFIYVTVVFGLLVGFEPISS
jgi:hypothetical protein